MNNAEAIPVKVRLTKDAGYSFTEGLSYPIDVWARMFFDKSTNTLYYTIPTSNLLPFVTEEEVEFVMAEDEWPFNPDDFEIIQE